MKRFFHPRSIVLFGASANPRKGGYQVLRNFRQYMARHGYGGFYIVHPRERELEGVKCYGTLDELFESLTLIQTLKIHPFPVFLVGSSFWSGLMSWIRDTLVRWGTISPEDMRLFQVVDDVAGIPASIKAYRDQADHGGFAVPEEG